MEWAERDPPARTSITAPFWSSGSFSQKARSYVLLVGLRLGFDVPWAGGEASAAPTTETLCGGEVVGSGCRHVCTAAAVFAESA